MDSPGLIRNRPLKVTLMLYGQVRVKMYAVTYTRLDAQVMGKFHKLRSFELCPNILCVRYMARENIQKV